MNMSTYPGLTAATRESVSLDEDELSDVEDEVFIRDGRNGYKLAEERGVKRPLMAPRRKIHKPDLTSRLKNRPPCRMLCIPCCYAFIALTIFLGLIVVVIVLVAIFPLPLDTVKSWIVSKTGSTLTTKSIPCTDLDISDVWTVSVPKLASESAMRTLDVNGDGVDDIVFGYGLGEDVPLPQQWFCPMFLGVKPPCQGGVQAIDGQSGATLWQRRLPHSVFTLHCTVDLSADNVSDCLASGKGGVLSALNGRDGSVIWEFFNNVTSLVMDIYSANFIPDMNNDGVQDVIAAHTVQSGGNRSGFLLVISGKTGVELSRVSTPNNTEILYSPQLFTQQGSELMILFGTGSENTPGALYMASLNDIYAKHLNSQILYTDPFKGVQSPVVLVDLDGDQQDDIVSAMFNSTIVAINGKTLQQIWNYTILNSETLSTPTPGYFTSDNVTDFLIKYQTGPEFPLYYYSQTIIIDGKSGKPIYNRPLVDTVGSQMGGLTISMDNHGNDMFIYWMADCKNFESRQDTFSFDKASNIRQKSKADLCKLRFNSTMVTKLYSLNQYNEPPGILLYTSENRSNLEFNNSITPLDEFNSYLQQNPDFDFNLRSDHILDSEDIAMDNYNNYKNMNFNMKLPGNINRLNNYNNYKNMNYKGGNSNFRHRDNDQGLVKDFSRDDVRNRINKNDHPQPQPDDKYSDYDQPEGSWAPSSVDELLDPQIDYPETYADDPERQIPLNNKMKTISSFNNRDPRSRPQSLEPLELSQSSPFPTFQNIKESSPTNQRTKKKNLSQDEYGPNDYKNVYMARNRLLHDLNDLPSEILRDTYVKHHEKVRNNKFQQRDLRFREHDDDDNNRTEDIVTKKFPESLWDLESEKELEDRENGYWRSKRETDSAPEGIFRMTSTGLLLKPLSQSQSENAIDLVFATYWVYPKKGAYVLLDKDEQCIRQKLLDSLAPNDKYHNLEKSTKEDLFTKMCLEQRGVILKPNTSPNNELKKSPYYNQISQLSLGQMTIYRLRLHCKCQILKPDEQCAQILPAKDQFWPSYMGKSGDGQFKSH